MKKDNKHWKEMVKPGLRLDTASNIEDKLLEKQKQILTPKKMLRHLPKKEPHAPYAERMPIKQINESKWKKKRILSGLAESIENMTW